MLTACRVTTDDGRLLYKHLQMVNVSVTFLSADITVGYTVTDVTVLESDGVATLTVSITMPPGADPIETSFSLLVNTLDGTATGLPWDSDSYYVPTHSVTSHSLVPVKLHNILLTFHISVAPGDYGGLTNFPLGPFSSGVRQLSFNVSIVNDNIPEDAETFSASLILDPRDQARLGNRVQVSPSVATVTIQDNDSKHA